MSKLKKPRCIIMFVIAGELVDNFIETLLLHCKKGDVIIGSGNSHFPDTDC